MHHHLDIYEKYLADGSPRAPSTRDGSPLGCRRQERLPRRLRIRTMIRRPKTLENIFMQITQQIFGVKTSSIRCCRSFMTPIRSRSELASWRSRSPLHSDTCDNLYLQWADKLVGRAERRTAKEARLRKCLAFLARPDDDTPQQDRRLTVQDGRHGHCCYEVWARRRRLHSY